MPTENLKNLETYSKSKQWEADARTAKIYYNSKQLAPEDALRINFQREPTAIKTKQYYDKQKLKEAYGYEEGIYNDPSAKKQNGSSFKDMPNSASFFSLTRMWKPPGGNRSVCIACLSVPAPALDTDKQPHFSYYVSNGVLVTKNYKDEMQFLFKTIEAALRDNLSSAFEGQGIKRLVLSQFGQGSFLEGLSETEKEKARAIFLEQLDVFLDRIKDTGVPVVISEYAKTKNSDKLAEHAKLLTGNIIETAKEHDFIVNPLGLSAPGSDSNGSQSFDGAMGMSSGILLTQTAWINPYLKDKKALVPVVIQEEGEIEPAKIESFSFDVKGQDDGSIYRDFEKIEKQFSKQGVLIYRSLFDCSIEGVREGRKFWFNSENGKFVMEKHKGSQEEYTLEQLKKKFNIPNEIQEFSLPALPTKERIQIQPPVDKEAHPSGSSLTEFVTKLGGKVVNNEKAISAEERVKYKFFIVLGMTQDGNLVYQYQSYYKKEYGDASYTRYLVSNKLERVENEISEIVSIEELAKKHKIIILDNMFKQAVAAGKWDKIGLEIGFMFMHENGYQIYNKQKKLHEKVLVDSTTSDKEDYHRKLDKAFEASKAGGVLVEREYYSTKNDLFNKETDFTPGKFNFLLYPSQDAGKYRMLISKEPKAPNLIISQEESVKVAYGKLRQQYDNWLKELETEDSHRRLQEIDVLQFQTTPSTWKKVEESVDSSDIFRGYERDADNNPNALNNLGYCYEIGLGMEHIEIDTAREFYLKAAAKENPTAMFNVGRLQLLNKNVALAIDWFIKAGKAGNSMAVCELGNLSKNGVGGLPVNPQKAFQLYERSADMGNPIAMKNLADCYENGLGVEKDRRKAIEYYQKSAENDNPYAMEIMAKRYRTGDGVDQSETLAAYWQTKFDDASEWHFSSRRKEYWSIVKMQIRD